MTKVRTLDQAVSWSDIVSVSDFPDFPPVHVQYYLKIIPFSHGSSASSKEVRIETGILLYDKLNYIFEEGSLRPRLFSCGDITLVVHSVQIGAKADVF